MKYIYLIPIIGLMACSESSEEISTETINELSEEVNELEVVSELEPQTVEDIDNETFSNLLAEKNGFLLDVRTPEEYAEGHIEGATNINFYDEDFSEQIDLLDSTIPVFVYCKSGGRSGQARDILAEKDFVEVYNLSTGFSQWNK